jgi:hypothetical protein
VASALLSRPALSRLARSAIVASLTTFVACTGGPSLAPETPAGVNLAGSWQLDRNASEDPQALIAQIQQKAVERMRGRRDDMDMESGEVGPQGPGPGGPGGAGGRGRGGPGGPGDARSPESGAASAGGFYGRRGPGGFIRARYTDALGPRLNGDSLTIEQSATRFVIERTESRRIYTPGGRSVVSVADGVADQSSGWKGREYVIDVRPQIGPRLTERYALTADGRLTEKISLTGDDLPKLEFTRVYTRGPAASRPLPTSN